MIQTYRKICYVAVVLCAVSYLFQNCQRSTPDASRSTSGPVHEKSEEKNNGEISKSKALYLETEFNFGEVEEGELVEHAFTLKNVGKGPLEILAAKPTCGCTVAEFDKIIEPGQEGKITLKFNTKYYKGNQSKHVNVTTNDASQKMVKLTLTGFVKVLVDVLPRAGAFFQTTLGNAQTKILAVKNYCPEKMEIVKVNNPINYLTVKYEPFTEKRWEELLNKSGERFNPQRDQKPEDADFLLILTLSDKAKPGEITGKITISTNLEKKKDIDLLIRGKIMGPLKLSPTYLNLINVDEDLQEPIIRKFILRHENNKRFTIDKITCAAPQFSFDSKRLQNKTYEILITYNGGFPVGRHPGLIHIETDVKEHPTVELGYSVKVVANKP